MKTIHCLSATALLALFACGAAVTAAAQRKGAEDLIRREPEPTNPPPPVVIGVAPGATAPPAAGAQPAYVYDQKPLPGGRPVLVRPEQAQAIIEKFKAVYPQLGSPRLVIYVNRNLVDDQTGLRVIARTEKGEITRTDTNKMERVNYENRYRHTDRKDAPLADRQTVRDIERLFGRPLRLGGASLADQGLATQLMSAASARELSTESEQARKDRAALGQIADVAVEVLIASKNITVAEVSGERAYTVPDIQATAIRLKDAQIMGQASSSDILGKERHAGFYARNFDVREITEAVALALMEDLLTGEAAPAAATK
jgi:hypothetical protein